MSLRQRLPALLHLDFKGPDEGGLYRLIRCHQHLGRGRL